MRHDFCGLLLAACLGLSAAPVAVQALTIDNFHVSCGPEHAQDLVLNRNAIGTTASDTFTACTPSFAEILGGSRSVSVTNVSGTANNSAQFSKAGMWLGVAGFSEATMSLGYTVATPIDLAAAGSEFRLNRVWNMISSGGSRSNNIGLPQEVTSGQIVTLSVTDAEGRTGSVTSPILFPGTATNLRLYTYPFVSFGMADLLADNAALDLTRVAALSLLFPLDNGYRNSQLLRIGGEDSAAAGFTVSGDPFISGPAGGAGGFPAVPLPAAGWMLLAGVAGLGLLARRRSA